jgi:Endonuclease/Exonuclease/phosphatase family
MATFLLWNVQKKPLDGLLVRLVQEHNVHIVILVERPEADAVLLQALQTQVTQRFTRVPSHERFGVYSRFPLKAFERLSPVVPCDRMDFWRLKRTNADTEVLLCAVHGLDKINNSEARQALFFDRLHEEIKRAEHEANHSRTLLVGDFNANPFEASMGSVSGLHAVRMRSVGGRPFRTVMGVNYEFFYNPMWSSYGQQGDSPPATFYYNGSDVHEVFWHMIDQVVLRPELLPQFPERRLRILRRAGPIDLLTPMGLPGADNGSDHLPILFDLSLRGAAHA